MSSVPAQKKREAVFQILFSLGMGDTNQESMELLLSKELGMSRQNVGQAFQRALAVLDAVITIDEQIGEVSKTYDIARISSVEKAVLRLGVYELMLDNDIPPKVAIAEAVRLTRKFSSPQAAAFVNALLDAIYKKSLGIVPDAQMLEESAKELQLSQEIAEEASQEVRKDDDDTN